MTTRTERHPAAPSNDLARQGRDGMTEEGTE
jgi:hypothetical protein